MKKWLSRGNWLPWFKFILNFCLRRKLPAPGTKGGLFCICVESRNLTWLIPWIFFIGGAEFSSPRWGVDWETREAGKSTSPKQILKKSEKAGHSTVRHEPPSGWIFKSKGVLESQDAALEQWLHGFAIIRWLSRKTKQDPTKFRFGNGFARRKASNFHARYSAVRQEPPSSWIVKIEDVLEGQDAALERSRSGYMMKRSFIWRILPL